MPFPALLKVTESRLRLAICGVYSLAIVAIIVTIIRVILLATDVESSIKKILVLTAVELTVCIVIGILPGVSSSFTKRYVQGGSESNKLASTSRLKSDKYNNRVFVQLPGYDSSAVKAGGDADAIELSQPSHRAVAFAEGKDEYNNLRGSTDQIIDTAKGGITRVTHISVARNDR